LVHIYILYYLLLYYYICRVIIDKVIKGGGCGCVPKKFEIFFLLKFNMVCMFWIVLMC
jgi:hypothetical protein